MLFIGSYDPYGQKQSVPPVCRAPCSVWHRNLGAAIGYRLRLDSLTGRSGPEAGVAGRTEARWGFSVDFGPTRMPMASWNVTPARTRENC